MEIQKVKTSIKSKETYLQLQFTPQKSTKIFGSLMKYFSSKQLPVQSTEKVL